MDKKTFFHKVSQMRAVQRDMLEFKYQYINHKYYVSFLNRLKG